MSDSEDSTVTYTAVSSPFKGLSDIGSPKVDGPPMMPEDTYAYVVAAFQAPPSLDYVPGPKEPEQAPLLLEFVPEPVYPEFMPPEDEVFPAEEQPLPAAILPTADSQDDDDVMRMRSMRAYVAMMRAAAPSTYILASRSKTPPSGTPPLLPIPLPTPSLPLLLPYTNHAEIRRDPQRDVGYGITDTWDEMLVGMPGAPAMDDTELDRRAHAHTTLLMEREASLSYDTARSEVRALRTTVIAQQTEIVTALQGQHGPARGPAHPEIPEEADSSF
ncbi:hypothetical protein Tco_0630061 [Tanacetum coccineum]